MWNPLPATYLLGITDTSGMATYRYLIRRDTGYGSDTAGIAFTAAGSICPWVKRSAAAIGVCVSRVWSGTKCIPWRPSLFACTSAPAQPFLYFGWALLSFLPLFAPQFYTSLLYNVYLSLCKLNYVLCYLLFISIIFIFRIFKLYFKYTLRIGVSVFLADRGIAVSVSAFCIGDS
jgi:hypothetical protein